MNTIGKILGCAAVLLSAAGCSDSNDAPMRLEAPVLSASEVGEDAFAVTWPAVGHAAFYAYSLDGAEEETTRELSVRFTGLKPSTEYAVSVKALSSDALYSASEASMLRVTTLEEQNSGKIESAAFDALVGAWSGKQTVKYATGIDPAGGFFFQTEEWTFDVEVAATVGEKNFRKENYLVCLGLGDFAKEGSARTYEQLLGEGFTEEEALEGFGPKWFLCLKEEGSIAVDATNRFNLLSWFENEDLGPFYLLGGTDDKSFADCEGYFPVSVAGDELRVGSFEAEGKVWTPSVFQWHHKQGAYARYYLGVSDIVLTRKK